MAADSGLALYRAQMGARKRAAYLAGSEDAPPFAALEIYGRTYSGGLLLRKPQSDDLGAQYVVFNGDQTWAAGTHGTVTNDLPCIAKYSTPLLTLSNRIAVGTKADDWGLSRGYEGFLAIGPVLSDDEKCVVLPNNVCRSPTTGVYYYNGNYSLCCTCCGCDRFNKGGDASTFCPNCTEPSAPLTLDCTVTFPCMGSRTITLDYTTAFGFDGVQPGCNISNVVDARKFEYTGSYSSSGVTPYSCDLSGQYCDPSIIVAPGMVVDYESLTVTIKCIDCGTGELNDCPPDGVIWPPCWPVDRPPGNGFNVPLTPRHTKWVASITWEKLVGCVATNVTYFGPVELLSCNPLSFTLSPTAITCNPSASLPIGQCVIADECADTCAYTDFDDCVGGDLQMDADETAEPAVMGGSPFGGDGGIF